MGASEGCLQPRAISVGRGQAGSRRVLQAAVRHPLPSASLPLPCPPARLAPPCPPLPQAEIGVTLQSATADHLPRQREDRMHWGWRLPQLARLSVSLSQPSLPTPPAMSPRAPFKPPPETYLPHVSLLFILSSTSFPACHPSPSPFLPPYKAVCEAGMGCSTPLAMRHMGSSVMATGRQEGPVYSSPLPPSRRCHPYLPTSAPPSPHPLLSSESSTPPLHPTKPCFQFPGSDGTQTGRGDGDGGGGVCGGGREPQSGRHRRRGALLLWLGRRRAAWAR